MKSVLMESRIHGIRVFTVDPIRKDSLIYEFDDMLDIAVDINIVANLPSQTKENLQTYGCVDKETKMFRFAMDNAKHINHSDMAILCL